MRAIEKVMEAHYQATGGKKLTGRGPYSGFCPVHQDRHRSLRITVNAHKVSVNCMAGCLTEAVLEAWGLEWADLYEDACNGYEGQDDILLSPFHATSEIEALKTELLKTLENLQGLEKDALQAVLLQWTSLSSLIQERVAQRRDAGRLDVRLIGHAAVEAAVKAYPTWNPGWGGLITYARKSIRGAIRDEAARQIGRAEELLTSVQVEIPEEAHGLEVEDHPSWCLQCGDPIPPHKRDDARFCSNRCRIARYRREQSADDYAEAILIKYGGLPEVHPEASEERHVERAFLREAVNELRRRRLYWLRLETWLLHEPWMLWRNPAYLAWREQMQEQEHKKTRALMRSPYEENGSKFSTKARTLANKEAFLAQEYEDPEDRMLDEGKDGAK